MSVADPKPQTPQAVSFPSPTATKFYGVHGIGVGVRGREGGERERRERGREKETRGYEPFALHATPHTLGYIVGRDQVAFRH